MALISRSWTLNRLRGRLQKVERAKDEAMQALLVRDQQKHLKSRFDYQDPGQVGSMLDEIASLQAQIAGLEAADPGMEYDASPTSRAASAMPAYSPQAMDEPDDEAAPVPVPRAPVLPHPDQGLPAPQGALDPAFQMLRAELNRIQRTSASGRIGVEELRQALATALASTEVLDATFATLRAEMAHMQRANVPGRIGLDALRYALRASLGGAGEDGPARSWDGSWPDPSQPGIPLEDTRDGWHWIRAPGKPLVVLSWHADSRLWGHRAGISPQKIAVDGVRYYGPCTVPVIAGSDQD